MVIYPMAHQAPKVSSCLNNLKQIGTCLRLYTVDHDGKWPATLREMYPEYITDFHVVLCPSLDTKSGAAEDMNQWSDYTYTPFDGIGDPAKVIVCSDKQAIHIKDSNRLGSRNVLFADGHVELRRGEALQN
jgi:prepilin-type processing-associated H-X9-DG protein